MDVKDVSRTRGVVNQENVKNNREIGAFGSVGNIIAQSAEIACIG
jgi:hypothetical protein